MQGTKNSEEMRAAMEVLEPAQVRVSQRLGQSSPLYQAFRNMRNNSTGLTDMGLSSMRNRAAWTCRCKELLCQSRSLFSRAALPLILPASLTPNTNNQLGVSALPQNSLCVHEGVHWRNVL